MMEIVMVINKEVNVNVIKIVIMIGVVKEVLHVNVNVIVDIVIVWIKNMSHITKQIVIYVIVEVLVLRNINFLEPVPNAQQ